MVDFNQILTLSFNRNPISKSDFEWDRFRHLKLESELEWDVAIQFESPNCLSSKQLVNAIVF